MMYYELPEKAVNTTVARADVLFAQHQERTHRHTDRMFAGLMILQWLIGIAVALWISPRTWAGATSDTHIHVWGALYVGGVITLVPVYLALARPGMVVTRHAIAIGQLLMSSLLIHLTGGRIETHFHVFGSLAFLAFYRDWRVILTGTLVTAVDHLLRSVLWPQSMYGVEIVETWRWVEHAGWVVFEATFLIISCASSLREVRGICERDARLEESNADLERKVAERTQQIEHQAFHDALTGLPNRTLFLNVLDKALARARRHKQAIAVLYLDLDGFKRVNDTLGHEAGDLLLQQVAARLKQCIRIEDTVARMGGDEFTLLLEDLNGQQDAQIIAERILNDLATPIVLPQGKAFVGASIGITCTVGGEGSLAVLRDADTAMYHAKSAGKGISVLFTADMNDRIQERGEIENELHRVLENNELRVYYQPLVNLSTGQITGVEALVRWQHPQRGLIPPIKFIPIAEEVGLIGPIGYWVMEEACRCVKDWMDRSPDLPPLTVSVNLSGRQLMEADVVTRVAEVLSKTGLPAQLLKLELTESIFLGDDADAVAKLRALKEIGVKLAIDDFGTGYSSMSTLSIFPIDTVKIDRAFINRLGEEEGKAIVAAIILLAKAMHLDVTSEGVETAEQVTQLQELDCEIAQGYFFAKPMTAENLEKRLRSEGRQYVLGIRRPATENFENLLVKEFQGHPEKKRVA